MLSSVRTFVILALIGTCPCFARTSSYAKLKSNRASTTTRSDQAQSRGARPQPSTRSYAQTRAPSLTDEQVVMFDRLDEDKNGEIDVLEFTASWHNAPFELWDQDDANGDGVITREEFARARNQGTTSEGQPSDQRVDLFSLLDDNNNGCISKQEFEADWHAPPSWLFRKEDANNDGCIRRHEFGSAVP